MNQSRSSTATKRSRAAAVHNQSERVILLFSCLYFYGDDDVIFDSCNIIYIKLRLKFHVYSEKERQDQSKDNDPTKIGAQFY